MSRITTETLTLSPPPPAGTTPAAAQEICRRECIQLGARRNDEAGAAISVRCLASTYAEGTSGSTTPSGPVFGSGSSNFGRAPDPGAAAGRAGRTATLSDPLGNVSVPQLLGRVINTFLGISGSVALVMFVYGGFLWLTSAGNAERIQQGKNAIVWATLGLMMIFGAYAIVNFVLGAILSAAG